jgi:hypothetical protein
MFTLASSGTAVFSFATACLLLPSPTDLPVSGVGGGGIVFLELGKLIFGAGAATAILVSSSFSLSSAAAIIAVVVGGDTAEEGRGSGGAKVDTYEGSEDGDVVAVSSVTIWEVHSC